MRPLILLSLLIYATACAPDAAGKSYRGAYTYGHEVNTFCPDNGSQCFWLSPDTSAQVREQMKKIYRDRSPGLYKPVCLIIDGEIDTLSSRTGFALDTDGLIKVNAVSGYCDSGDNS